MASTMTAEDRITKLTSAWYGYVVLTGALGVVLNGLGVFSLLSGVFSTLFSLLVTFWLGRLLLRRSSFTRGLLVVVSAVMFCVGLLGSGKLVLAFFGEGSLSLLGYAALGLMGVSMNARSFRVLTSKQVKAYFA